MTGLGNLLKKIAWDEAESYIGLRHSPSLSREPQGQPIRIQLPGEAITAIQLRARWKVPGRHVRRQFPTGGALSGCP